MPIQPLQIPGFAAPTPIDFSSLGNMTDVYKKAKDEQTLENLGKGLADGSIDYKQAAGMAAGAGKLDVAMSLMKLGEDKRKEADFTKNFGQMFGGQPQAAPTSSSAPQRLGNIGAPQTVDPNVVNSIDAMADLKPGTQEKMPTAQGAVSGIESGGNYQAVGPVTGTGDRAYGKYQVMGANIPAWTKEVLGREMSPQEFLSNQDAQDAVFNAKFGGYSEKYGTNGAARAWHAGERGMNNPAASDQLGTRTADYGSRVAGVVDGEGGALPPNARPAGPASPQQQPGAAPTPRTNPIQNNIPALAYMMANSPDKQQQEMAKVLLTEAIKSPDNLKEYDFYQRQETSQGRQPLPLFDWTIKIKQAGATAITNDMRGENSFESEFGKKQADRWNGYITSADQAQRKLVDINNMRVISQRLGSQGAAAGVKEAIGPYAEALGVNIEGVPDIQAFSSIIERLAPQQRAPGSGATSDIEYKGFKRSLPVLSSNPQAREVILDTMQAMENYSIAQGEIATRLASKEINRSQAEKEMRGLGDPMQGFREWRKANPELYGSALKNAGASASSVEAPAASPKSAAPKAPPPSVGHTEQGYRFKGGDPSKPESWEPAQ